MDQKRGHCNNLGTKSHRRTPGVVCSLITKGHVVDLSQSALTSRWLKMLHAGKNDITLLDLIHKNFNLVNVRKVSLSGPGEALVQSSRRLRVAYDTPSSVRCNDRVHDLLSCTIADFGHDLRVLGRRMMWKQVRGDAGRARRENGEPRPHLHDLGLHHGVNRHGTMKLYSERSCATEFGRAPVVQSCRATKVCPNLSFLQAGRIRNDNSSMVGLFQMDPHTKGDLRPERRPVQQP